MARRLLVALVLSCLAGASGARVNTAAAVDGFIPRVTEHSPLLTDLRDTVFEVARMASDIVVTTAQMYAAYTVASYVTEAAVGCAVATGAALAVTLVHKWARCDTTVADNLLTKVDGYWAVTEADVLLRNEMRELVAARRCVLDTWAAALVDGTIRCRRLDVGVRVLNMDLGAIVTAFGWSNWWMPCVG
jgi:hypothetical protein